MRDDIRTFSAAQVCLRRYSELCGLLLLTSWLAAGAAHAQFQDPTPAELKMTSDPKAPGAAAVILDLEHNCDDVQSIQTFYERIKVLTEKGKELATIQIPYAQGTAK